MRPAQRRRAARIQNAARNSMEWFENVGERYSGTLEPSSSCLFDADAQPAHQPREPAPARPAWLEGLRALVRRARRRRAGQANGPVPPMFTPYTMRGLTLKNRVVVSPMAQYSAVDGVPGDYHLVHLGARAMGGAALVFAEMTCVSPDARITPAAPACGTTRSATPGGASSTFVHQPAATPRSACSSATPAPRARPSRPGTATRLPDQPLAKATGRCCRRRPVPGSAERTRCRAP
jgi:anthraniloyl-CoA monooxygenase